MAWNEPGSSGGKDPWGQRKKDQGPPDLDKIVKNIQRKLGGIFGGKGGGSVGPGGGKVSRFGIGAIIIVVLVLWIVSGFYVVQQGERGVVLQFGKKTDVTEAGLHWHLPFPIESVDKVNVEQVYVLQIGYRSSERSSTSSKLPKEALMLTQDENIVDVELAVQYKIKDPSAFLFNVRDPKATIISAAQSAVREVVGKNTMDFILTQGRDVIGQDTQTLLQSILDRYNSGIHIVTVQLQDAKAPEEVTAAFEDAVKAREDEQRVKNEAEAYSNDIIPRARGDAARIVLEAEGYQASTIARAEGDARRFSQVVTQYDRAPAVTRERMYLDTMEKVLSNTTKIFVDLPHGNNVIYLPLDKIVRQTTTAATAGPVDTLQPLPEPGATLPPDDTSQSRLPDSLRGRGR
ncbi:MAG: FtsH protease activity modulator HflK [Acidiferrobacterales bacterium]